MATQEVLDAIPHRAPFLFIDEVVEFSADEKRIVCRKHFTGEEDFFRGHYPNFPVVPGVIVCETGLQSGAILLSKLFPDLAEQKKTPLVAKVSGLRFKQMVRPGAILFLESRFKNSMGGMMFLEIKAKLNGKTVLAFDAACALADAAAFAS